MSVGALPAYDPRRARARRAGTGALGLLALIGLSVLVLVPILVLVLTAFREGTATAPGAWTFDGVIRTWLAPATWTTVLNSTILALSTTTIALALGTFLAWVAVKTDAPLRRFMTPGMATLIFLPALFYGLGWVLFTRGRNAPVAQLARFFGAEGAPESSGWVPLVLLIVGFIVPVAYLFMLPPLLRLDSTLDDAARAAGATKAEIFWTITVPLLRPSLLGVFVLMTSYSFSAFELPLLFGMPAGIPVFSTAVYTAAAGGTGVPDVTGAAALSLILIVIVTSLVLVRYAYGRRRVFSTVGGKGYNPSPRNYGRAKFAFSAVFVLVMVFAGVLPFVQMIVGSLQPVFGVSTTFTLDNYRLLLADPAVGRAIGTTIWVSALGGFVAVSIAIPLVYLAKIRGGWVRTFAGLVTWAPASIPGVIVGLALITAYLPIPGLRSLFGTPWFLLIGFVVVVLPITARAVEGPISQISTELEEAARVSGAGAFTTFAGVTLRLALPSFLSGWFLSGLVIAGNFSLPALLSSPAMQTVAVRAYQYYALGETSKAAALFLLLMATLLALAATLWIAVFVLRVAWRATAHRRHRTPATMPA